MKWIKPDHACEQTNPQPPRSPLQKESDVMTIAYRPSSHPPTVIATRGIHHNMEPNCVSGKDLLLVDA